MTRVSRSFALLAAVAFALTSCNTTPTVGSVRQDTKIGRLDDAAEKLQKMRENDPDDFQTRMGIGSLYFELARKALDEKDLTRYYRYLGQAQTDTLAAARLEPTSPYPHTYLGIIGLYAGDLKGSRNSFRNALKLAIADRYNRYGGTFYSNLAQVEIFSGDLQAARRHLTKATKVGTPQPELDFVGILLAWKANDMVEARDIFNGASLYSKDFATTWDGALLPKKMESFDDFAANCCGNLSCGPYMVAACKRERHSVAAAAQAGQTLADQERIERERREKLREIYGEKKKGGLDVTLEDDPNAPKPAPAEKPAAETPAKKDSGGKR